MNKLICYLGIALFATAIYPAHTAVADSPASRASAAPLAANGQGKMDSSKIQERMFRMHDQMHKIMNTKEGVERERLVQEHRMMIEENMRMLQDMGGMN